MHSRIVRLATPGDIPVLVSLINSAYRVEDFFVNGDRTNVEDVSARMATSNGWFLVIDGMPGELAGAVYVDVDGPRGHFALLSVDPFLQRKGVGRALIDAAEKHCRSAGCQSLELEIVNLRSDLPDYYTAFGFAAVGTAPFPESRKLSRDAHLVRMSKPLAPTAIP